MVRASAPASKRWRFAGANGGVCRICSSKPRFSLAPAAMEERVAPPVNPIVLLSHSLEQVLLDLLLAQLAEPTAPFDGYESVLKTGDDTSGEDLRLHISVLVDISKGDGSNDLEFICSAWPDRLEVQKVYVLHRGAMPAKPYLGPDFRDVNEEIQKKLRGYVDTGE